jgi:hypothetical protein
MDKYRGLLQKERSIQLLWKMAWMDRTNKVCSQVKNEMQRRIGMNYWKNRRTKEEVVKKFPGQLPIKKVTGVGIRRLKRSKEISTK